MNSCGIRWHYIMCWKWLPPSIIDTAEHYVQCCPPFAAEHHSQCWWTPAEFCFSRLLRCEVCTCTLSPPGSPKERNMEMTSLEIGGPKVLSKDCLAVKQKLTWWKRVPLSTTCWGHSTLLMHNSDMNRQCFWSKFHLLLIFFSRITDKNKLSIPYESLYTRGNNIGSVFEATWNKISVTFSILTVYSQLLLTCSHNLFWKSLTLLYQFLKNYNANFFVLRIYHPSIWLTNKTLYEIKHFHNSGLNFRCAQRHNPEYHNIN